MDMTNKEKQEWESWLLLCRNINSSYVPPVNESERDKRKRIQRLLDPANFNEFINYYFATEETKFADLAWFHHKAIENVYVHKCRVNVWELHREAAKSVFADIFIPIHKLASGTLTGFILGSETEHKAKNLIKDVEAHLRNNRRLINDFGDFGVMGSWRQGFFQLSTGVGFWAFGLGQNPAGVRDGFKRPNLGVIDDADTKDLAKNQTLTKEAVDWIRGEFMGCLAKDDRTFILVNNRVHKHGITAHMVGDLQEGDPINENVAHIKAHLVEYPDTHEPAYPPSGLNEDELVEYYQSIGAQPAWDEYYSLRDACQKIIDYGFRNAMRQMFHKHIMDGGRFNDDNLPWVEPRALKDYDALVTYCDPAFGESGKGCYRGIVLIGRIGNDFDILWAWLRQTGSFARAHAEIAYKVENGLIAFTSDNARFKYKVTCEHWCESNELQKILLKTIYKDINTNADTVFYPRFDMDQKANKIGRIESLEPLADNGHIRFNKHLKDDRDMILLHDQFKAFPDGFIDGPDAVEGGISKLNKRIKQSSNTLRGGKYNRKRDR